METSPTLRAKQAERVPEAEWHEAIDDLPQSPMLVVANEFFDALPVRQFVGAMERKIIIAAGGLAFDRDGEIIEKSPARDEAAAAVARLSRRTAASRWSSITVMNERLRATRCRRCVDTATCRPSSILASRT